VYDADDKTDEERKRERELQDTIVQLYKQLSATDLGSAERRRSSARSMASAATANWAAY